jgi:hypothetical protein
MYEKNCEIEAVYGYSSDCEAEWRQAQQLENRETQNYRGPMALIRI